MPNTIRQLVTDEEDMELMGTRRILQETGRTKANAVILPQEGTDEPVLCSQLFSMYPDLTIVSIASDVGAAFVQQLFSSSRASQC